MQGYNAIQNFKAIPLLNFVIGKNLWQFLLGIVLYYLFINKPKSILNNIAIFFIFSLSFILIDVPYGKNHSSIVYGYLGFFMIYASFNLSQSNKSTYLKKASNILGESSYALYLISPVLYLLFDNNFFIAVASIILAILLNILVENKLLYLVRKIFLGD
jgi:peptidoglycan/LPS O-acetylase OafA/YrhL